MAALARDESVISSGWLRFWTSSGLNRSRPHPSALPARHNHVWFEAFLSCFPLPHRIFPTPVCEKFPTSFDGIWGFFKNQKQKQTRNQSPSGFVPALHALQQAFPSVKPPEQATIHHNCAFETTN
jgi:hypothetical protein